MSTLAEFFKGSDTTLGVFYPNHYLIAVFPDLAKARQVAQKLRFAGFEENDVAAADGQDMIQLTKEETGPGSFLMQALSRFFGTEQMFTDHDLEHAREGAGFVAVHCPNEKAEREAWAVIQPEKPLDARYYANDGIEHLAGDFKTD